MSRAENKGVDKRNSPVCCYCDLYEVRDNKHIDVDDAEMLQRLHGVSSYGAVT